MPDWLTELVKLAGEATPGPWTLDGYMVLGDCARCVADCDEQEDAAYHAACSPERILALAGVAAAALERESPLPAFTDEQLRANHGAPLTEMLRRDDALLAALAALEATP